MVLSTEEIGVGQTGLCYVAAVGTAFPANIDAPISAAWDDLGYNTVDGVEVEISRNTFDIDGWQSLETLRKVVTAVPKMVRFSLRQLNEVTWRLAMGGGTWSQDAPGAYSYAPPAPEFVDERACIIEWQDGDNVDRLCFRRVLNAGGVKFSIKRSDSVIFPIEFSVLAADSGDDAWFAQSTRQPLLIPTS